LALELPLGRLSRGRWRRADSQGARLHPFCTRLLCRVELPLWVGNRTRTLSKPPPPHPFAVNPWGWRREETSMRSFKLFYREK
ncbi:hypothetical protein JOQ06_006084, partial [Pogonophryne albipinna]